jgi:hypothetical protein
MGDSMSWNFFLVGTEDQIIAANNQINNNAGYPCPGTERWGIPTQAYEQDFWFIPMPMPDAIYNGHTGQELMLNVINVVEEESQSNWWPPMPPLGE